MFESKTINDMQIGDKESITVTLNEKNIKSFAEATGDFNPVHMDSKYASETPFGERIAHGVLLTGVVSGLLGTKFPGLGTIAREMTSKFTRPVFIGETVTATAELIEKKEKLNMCTFKYRVTNQENKVVVKGTAVVLPKTG